MVPALFDDHVVHTVLYTFQGSYDGQGPGEVLFGSNGALYGTTYCGGTPAFQCQANTKLKHGCGTVFELTPPSNKGGTWTKTILHTFGPESWPLPFCWLIPDDAQLESLLPPLRYNLFRRQRPSLRRRS